MSSRALRRAQKEKEIEEIVDSTSTVGLEFEQRSNNKNIFQQVKF
jgi:hypothetical protein